MESYPDLLFILNVKENACAIREAQAANVPVMGVVDTDCDPQDITWPIPANDDHIASVGLVCEKVILPLVAYADALRLQADRVGRATGR